MVLLSQKNLPYLALAGVALVGAAYFVLKKEAGSASEGIFQSVGQGVGGGVVHLVDGVLSGGAIAIGEAVGIPRTNLSKCEQAKKDGRTWDASFDCPASDFLSYLWN